MTGLDVRALRFEHKMNQFEFADHLGLDRRTLQRVEKRGEERVTRLLAWACRGVAACRR